MRVGPFRPASRTLRRSNTAFKTNSDHSVPWMVISDRWHQAPRRPRTSALPLESVAEPHHSVERRVPEEKANGRRAERQGHQRDVPGFLMLRLDLKEDHPTDDRGARWQFVGRIGRDQT